MTFLVNTATTWLSSPVTVHTGTLAAIKRHVPSFDRRPFAPTPNDLARARDHSRLDTIVRRPIGGDTDHIPVGVVSRDYVLLPHRAVIESVENALGEAGLDAAPVSAELRLTAFGERMALSIRLPDNYAFDPGDRHRMTVRLECLNSVDGSTRFRAVMGWYRLVCSNGLTIGVTRAAADRRHIGHLPLEQVGDVLHAGLHEYSAERNALVRWRNIEVPRERLEAWVDADVKARWGVKAAARAFHIATTGRDATVSGPYARRPPSRLDVEPAAPVPGSPAESGTLFDVSQVLAWLARERRDVQQQIAWREEIPSLIASLADEGT